MNAWENLIKALRAIAEGYPVEGHEDRFVVVENPKYKPDDGSNPLLAIDVDSLDKAIVVKKP